jgi:hypothetical protein
MFHPLQSFEYFQLQATAAETVARNQIGSATKTTAAIAGHPNTAPVGASPLFRASSLRRGVAGRVRS